MNKTLNFVLSSLFLVGILVKGVDASSDISIKFTQDVESGITSDFQVTAEVTGDAQPSSLRFFPSDTRECTDKDRRGKRTFKSGEPVTLSFERFNGRYVCAMAQEKIKMSAEMLADPDSIPLPTTVTQASAIKVGYKFNTATIEWKKPLPTKTDDDKISLEVALTGTNIRKAVWYFDNTNNCQKPESAENIFSLENEGGVFEVDAEKNNGKYVCIETLQEDEAADRDVVTKFASENRITFKNAVPNEAPTQPVLPEAKPNNGGGSSGGGSSGGGPVYSGGGSSSSSLSSSSLSASKITPTKTTEVKGDEAVRVFALTGAVNPTITTLDDTRLDEFMKKNNIAVADKNIGMTRAEVVKLLAQVTGQKTDSVDVAKLQYTDVGKNTEYAKYIAFATENKIVSGYEDGTFRPNNIISRAELMKVLVNSIGYKLADKQTQFADVEATHTLALYIQTAYNNKIINGVTATTFEPNRAITKGELAKIIYNILYTK